MAFQPAKAHVPVCDIFALKFIKLTYYGFKDSVFIWNQMLFSQYFVSPHPVRT